MSAKINRELMILYGARHAIMHMLKQGNYSFAKAMDDGSWQTIDYVDILNALTEMIEDYKEGKSEA